MSDNLASPVRVDLAPSILTPRPPARVRVWVLIVSIIVAFGLGWAVATLVPGSTPSVVQTESPSATPQPEIDTDDDSAFVTVATRDLDDFEKDLDDVDTTLDENGFWRLLSNAVELNFNVSQLLGHDAPRSIDSDWAAGLAQLENDVNAIEAGITAGSESHVRSAVADARDTVDGLRGVVARVD